MEKLKKHKGDCGSPICRACCINEAEYQEKLNNYVKWLENLNRTGEWKS